MLETDVVERRVVVDGKGGKSSSETALEEVR
jgi:hypothetical protein